MQNSRTLTTIGLVDIHFHGAFGIDLMSATPQKLNLLSNLLWKKGIAGFCPTTVSAPKKILLNSVHRLGQWIRERSLDNPGAVPLGIHLEGPFLSSGACGAHPLKAIRKFSWEELQELWTASHETLKILTLAPESLRPDELKELGIWCRDKKVTLSLGHSLATAEVAENAFSNGFTGITHAWNAMPFHSRRPGILGAAIGRKNLYLELIIDRAHLSPEVIRWTRKLHSPHPLCFISDCISAGGNGGRSKPSKKWHTLGTQQVQFSQGACRLKNGQLAGGGLLLSEAYTNWATAEATELGQSPWKVLKETAKFATQIPLEVLGFSKKVLSDKKVTWKVDLSGKIQLFPVDSAASTR
jgi:N-acetylglucosamine-6-phosphate deacetylase